MGGKYRRRKALKKKANKQQPKNNQYFGHFDDSEMLFTMILTFKLYENCANNFWSTPIWW